MVKVVRSYPAPESLAVEAAKKNGSYKEKDVVERLKSDFNDKCYICEIKDLQDPEVEHLLPHKNGMYPERKFDWDNLFWACGHCNKVKNNEKYDDGIIDCCKQDPEALLKFSLAGDDVDIRAINVDDSQSVLTATLIYETFNLRNTGIRIAACDTRMDELRKAMIVLYKELEKYQRKPESERNRRMMRVLLSRSSAFAAFKRGYVREHLNEYPGLKEYVC